MNQNIDYIPFARPTIGSREEEAVLRVLRSGWLTTGAETLAFEKEFAETVSSPFALAVNSATSGLHLALEALGVGQGDKVVTTPYTFTATAETLRYLGADPLFADIEEKGYSIDPLEVMKAFKPPGNRFRGTTPGRPKGIIPVHFGGAPCNMEELLRITRENDAFILEDSAHAFPVKYKGRHLGTLGDAGVYSFYATKTITTGEGGMVTVSDPELARRIKIMRLHGIDRDVWDRYTAKDASWSYAVVEAGYKYNMPDIAAALGRVQLERAHEFLTERQRIARLYLDRLSACGFLELPDSRGDQAWHLFPLRIREDLLTIGRDEYIEKLGEAGIGTSVHYIPLHLMPYYRNRYGFKPEDFPRSLDAFRRSFSLPVYPGLTEDQTEHIIRSVQCIGESARRRTLWTAG